MSSSHPFSAQHEPTSPHQKQRIVVAMSGGVDSSVVAAMLAEQGHEVIGITLQLYDHGAAIHRAGSCCAGQDIHDAQRVAQKLGIAHYVLDYESRFKQDVIDKFTESYLNGETPIPCVECNRSVKFRDLLRTAQELGADVLATGHYVASRPAPSNVEGARALYRAADPSKDQSYFLYATTPAQLSLLRFPLGEMTKEETRQLAIKYELNVADKPDSQDICFVPNGKYADVIEKLRPDALRGGDVMHVDGRVLGKHDGILHFTVGQRKGLGISSTEPLYVLRLDADNARVIVGPKEALLTKRIMLRDVNWLGDFALSALPDAGLEVAVRVRSTREPKPAILRQTVDGVQVELLDAEEGVAPGQACVFYDSNDIRARVLGGGTILRQNALQNQANVVTMPAQLSV